MRSLVRDGVVAHEVAMDGIADAMVLRKPRNGFFPGIQGHI